MRGAENSLRFCEGFLASFECEIYISASSNIVRDFCCVLCFYTLIPESITFSEWSEDTSMYIYDDVMMIPFLSA